MVDRAILVQQFRLPIAGIMRVGKAEVDQKRVGCPAGLTFVEIRQHLLRVPGAARFVRATAFAGVVADGEQLVGGFVTVAHFAGAHGGVSRAVEHGGDRILLEFGWTQPCFHCTRSIGQMPDGASAHDHVPRRRADGAAEGTHVIRTVEGHPLGRQAIEHRRLQRRFRVVDFQVERRLVVDQDEQDIGTARLGGHGRSDDT